MSPRNAKTAHAIHDAFQRLQTPLVQGIAPFVCLILCACRTAAPMPLADLSQPDWTVRRGQAVWRSNAKSTALAGELVLATHSRGATLVEFSKTPLPLVVARIEPGRWTIQFVAENRSFSGKGRPPGRLGWLRLASCFQGEPPPDPWNFCRNDTGDFRLENSRTGERIEGYLEP